MPDILIRGMDKPHNCFQCDLSHLRGERLFCHVTKDEVLRSKIASDCPIQELPEHGDLIERDVAYDKIAEQETSYYMDMDGVDSGLLEVPVIVPSNKEDAE